MRTLTITIVTFNVTYGAAWSVLVLHPTDVLDLGAIGFGLLSTVGALGGMAGTTSRTVRMRAVPMELQGRVGSLYAIGVFGGILAGQALGGVIARIWGITGPFWFAFVGSAVLVVLMWKELAHVAHADEVELARAAA